MPAEVQVEGAVEPPVLDVLHDALDALWAAAPDVPSVERARFGTAVLELATNALRHGVPASPGGVHLGATLRAADGELVAHLWDDGPALDVDLDSPPPSDLAAGGRGLLLVRRAMDTVTLAREGDRNVWHLVRRYAAEASSDA